VLVLDLDAMTGTFFDRDQAAFAPNDAVALP
jgi:hypothetical protein